MPQARQLAPSIAEIKETVCRSYGIPEETLASTIRSRVNKPRNLAIYLSRRLSRVRLKDIADQFGLGSYSSVSSVVGRTGKLLSQDRNLAERLKKIRKERKYSLSALFPNDRDCLSNISTLRSPVYPNLGHYPNI